MAIDRARLVQNVYDTLGQVAVGPVPRALFPQWQSLRQIPHDVPRARQILDSLGWTDADGDGVRARGGVPLEFGILVTTSSSSRRRYGVLLQDQLKQVGARVRLDEMDFSTFLARQADRRFDAIIGSWVPAPGNTGILGSWGRIGARPPNTTNAGSYESPAFDAAVEQALTSIDPARRQASWTTAYQTIIDDAPAVWLYEPRMVAGAHRRLNIVGMRADAWWAGLADWSIARGQRIARDR
jgi:peptide/nickel transport system substrate-binding protein